MLLAGAQAEPTAGTTIRVRTVGLPAVVLAAAEEPAPVDPCWDYARLEAGTGDSARQGQFNLLDARGYARWRMACVYGWGTAEWECLDQLWREESGWRHQIRHGIAQRMPEKTIIAEVGPDYRQWPRRQVANGLAYIAGRYGRPLEASMHRPKTPCRAGY